MEYCSQCHATTTEACSKCHADGLPPGPVPSAPPAGMVADGRALYSRYCSTCHGMQGGQVASVSLLSNEYLTKQGFFALERMASEGHGGMPAFGKAHGGPLTDDEIRAIIAHLKLAAEGPGQARGDLLFDKNCAVCHGAKGDKMPLVNLSSAAFIGSLKAGGIAQVVSEGKGGMPAFGKLRGGSLSFDEIVAIERFVATMGQGPGPVTPKAIPHDLAGRDDCLVCHGAGGLKAGARRSPGAHQAMYARRATSRWARPLRRRPRPSRTACWDGTIAWSVTPRADRNQLRPATRAGQSTCVRYATSRLLRWPARHPRPWRARRLSRWRRPYPMPPPERPTACPATPLAVSSRCRPATPGGPTTCARCVTHPGSPA